MNAIISNFASMNDPQYISSEELLRVLFYSPNATAVYGENFTVLSANSAMLSFWGKDRSIMGKPLIEALPELQGQPFIGILEEVWRSGQTYLAKNVLASLFVDGSLKDFHFDFEYKAILDDQGNTQYILNTASEVTERMAAQKVVEEKSAIEQQLNDSLAAINEEYHVSNEELAALNEEYQTINENLSALNEEYLATNEELNRSQLQLEMVNNNLSESEFRFRALVDHAPVAIAIYKGENFNIEHANAQMLCIWELDNQILSKPLSSVVQKLAWHADLKMMEKIFSDGIIHTDFEVKYSKFSNGMKTDAYLDVIYKPIMSTKSFDRRIIVVVNDVTEKVYSRQETEELNTRLQIALDAGKLGSTEVDMTTGVMKSNDQFKKNYGFAADEDFNYTDLFNAILPEYRDPVRALVREAMDVNGVYHAEYPIRWRDGSLHWIQAHGRPRYDTNGRADRMVGMTADITEAKLFEQHKDDFLSIASHELKTPITALKGSVQLLDRVKSKPFSDLHIKLIDQVGKSVDKIGVLVDDLLNMNRMNQDQLKLNRTNFNLYDMLIMSCNHVRIDGKYTINVMGDSNIIVCADENRIDQVVVNFVNNAVKYAPDSKIIEIKIEELNDMVKVLVRDFGPGIQANFLPNLFDRYFRVDHSGKSYSGLGLGLYICSEIIKKHAGTIGAESEIGEGSTFWFCIPRLCQ